MYALVKYKNGKIIKEKGNNAIFYKNGTFYKDIDFNF